MLIDWFTVVAQALNFLVLIWLMKRFLYKPILNAIDAREKKIAEEVAGANKQRDEAKEESEEFKRKNVDFEKHRKSLFNKATEDADAERKRLFAELREESTTLREKRLKSLRSDQENLIAELNRRAQDEIFSIARKTLNELSNASLEEKICEAFIQKMSNLDIDEKKALKESFKLSSDIITLRSAFELSDATKKTLLESLHKIFTDENSIEFETDPDIIAGIELTGSGQRVRWSISGYLATLEKSMRDGINDTIPKESLETKQTTKQTETKAP